MYAIRMTFLIGGPPAPQIHVCFTFFENIIFRPCSICLIFFVFPNIDICYTMQESSDLVVLESTKSNLLVTHLSPLHRYMYVSFSLKTSFFVHVVYVSRFLCIIWHWHMLFYAGIYWESGAWRAPKWVCCWPISDEPIGKFMYRFLCTFVYGFPWFGAFSL